MGHGLFAAEPESAVTGDGRDRRIFPAHLRPGAAEKTFISQHHKTAISPGLDAEPDSMHSGTDICVATVAPWIPADQE
jgi:hypothetical protein